MSKKLSASRKTLAKSHNIKSAKTVNSGEKRVKKLPFGGKGGRRKKLSEKELKLRESE